MTPKNALLTVAKRPAPGRTKTRLTPPLTPVQASALYEHFLCDTLELMRNTPDVQRLIAYLPPEEQAYFTTLAPDFAFVLQEGDDLGARLDNAIQHHLGLGYEKTVIMDSDSPTLPVRCLAEAFSALTDDVDVTLGPCDDGGYYLIGTKAPVPRLLREVEMSTPNVVADTLAIAKEEGLRVHLLPTWYDIDDAATLQRLINELRDLPPEAAQHTRQFLQENPAIVDLL